jgi:hypothetical protein
MRDVMDMRAPDYISALTAWRFWKIRKHPRDGTLWLKSVVRNDLWPPLEKFEAQEPYCVQGHRQTVSPEAESKSGIYAYRSLTDALSGVNLLHYWCRGAFLGKVRLWGVVQQHEFGYRAQFAYPDSLEMGVCCVCRKIIDLRLEPFAIGWMSLHISEDFSVNGLICAGCNDKYYSIDASDCYREFLELTGRYGIG